VHNQRSSVPDSDDVRDGVRRSSHIREILRGHAINRAQPAPAIGWTIDAAFDDVLATVAQDRTPRRVIAASPEQVVLEDPSGRLAVGTQPLLLGLYAGKKHLHVAATLSREPSSASVIVARPVSPTQMFARDLLAIVDRLIANRRAASPSGGPLVQEVITDGARQSTVVESLIRYGCTGALRIGGRPAGSALPTRITAHGIVFRSSVPVAEGPFTIELVGYNSLYALDFDGATALSNGFVGVPVRMLRLRHRSFRRVDPPPGTFVEFHHPVWPAVIVRRPIRDISAHGLSFEATLLADLVYPGLCISNAKLTIADRHLDFSGEVKSLTRDPSGNHYYCGMQLAPASRQDEAYWSEALDACSHATTRIRGAWARPIWDLYNRAGYFDLSGKDPSSFDRLFESFERVSSRIEAAPQLACQAVWPHDEGHVEAAMSMLKVYSSSWLVFQLAKISGPTRRDVPGRVVLRDLHLRCYEHAQRDPQLRWLIGIPQVRNSWSRLVHYDLPHKHVATGEAEIVRFRAIEVAVRGPAAPKDHALEVRPGTVEERAVLLEHIRQTKSPIYTDALDLVPERFDLPDIRSTWEGSGFNRKRAVYVAVSDEGLQAAAILESADEGIHLFRLLDSVRLFSLVRGGEMAFGSLLEAARGWYENQHKSAYIAFLEDDAPLPAGSPPRRMDLGLADFAILAAARLPELLEHVYEVTAPRRSSTAILPIRAELQGEVVPASEQAG
jgi:hypothetical protein